MSEFHSGWDNPFQKCWCQLRWNLDNEVYLISSKQIEQINRVLDEIEEGFEVHQKETMTRFKKLGINLRRINPSNKEELVSASLRELNQFYMKRGDGMIKISKKILRKEEINEFIKPF